MHDYLNVQLIMIDRRMAPVYIGPLNAQWTSL